MNLDTVIVEINRTAREHRTAQFREAAFNILHNVVRFDTASWSSVNAVGLIPDDMLLWRQHSGSAESYLKVRTSDVICLWTSKNAEKPQLFNWSSAEDPRQYVPKFKDHCEENGYINILSAMIRSSSSTYTNISLSRRDSDRPFRRQDSSAIQRLIPHLLNAWIVNHVLHPTDFMDDQGPYDAVTMACSRSGKMLGESSRFLEILREDIPDWDAHYLPDQILARINRHRSWKSARVKIASKPIADVHLVAIRRLSGTALTARELEICRRAALGLTYKQIAEEFGISPGTVKNHLYNSYSKLNVGSRISLFRVLNPAGI